MNHKIKVGKGKARHQRENQKRFVHEEINTAAMKRCWVNAKTFILIPADADEEAERRKYLDNQQHYSSVYDTGKLGRLKKD